MWLQLAGLLVQALNVMVPLVLASLAGRRASGAAADRRTAAVKDAELNAALAAPRSRGALADSLRRSAF